MKVKELTKLLQAHPELEEMQIDLEGCDCVEQMVGISVRPAEGKAPACVAFRRASGAFDYDKLEILK